MRRLGLVVVMFGMLGWVGCPTTKSDSVNIEEKTDEKARMEGSGARTEEPPTRRYEGSASR